MFKNGALALPNSPLVRNLLAWVAFVLAVTGGVTATGTFLGRWIAAVVGVFWWWMPLVLMVVVAVLVLWDLAFDGDGVPNRRAIYGAIVWPSLPLSLEGTWGETLRGWVGGANRHLDNTFAGRITDSPRGSAAVLTGIAVVTITVAVLYAERYATRAKATRRPAALRPGPGAVPGWPKAVTSVPAATTEPAAPRRRGGGPAGP